MRRAWCVGLVGRNPKEWSSDCAGDHEDAQVVQDRVALLSGTIHKKANIRHAFADAAPRERWCFELPPAMPMGGIRRSWAASPDLAISALVACAWRAVGQTQFFSLMSSAAGLCLHEGVFATCSRSVVSAGRASRDHEGRSRISHPQQLHRAAGVMCTNDVHKFQIV